MGTQDEHGERERARRQLVYGARFAKRVGSHSCLALLFVLSPLWRYYCGGVIMADGFVNSKLEEASNFNSFPGTAMMLQTLCIFISAMILMWNRAVASSDYDAF